MQRPSIDHSILSPSGHVSRASRAAAIQRAGAALFPPGYWDKAEPAPDTTAERLRAKAAELRGLAERGMHPRRYVKEAEKLEAQAAAM